MLTRSSADKLYLTSVDAIQIHERVEQRQPVGKLQDIFDAFHVQWKQRWCEHDGLPASHWAEIVEFSKRTMNLQPTPMLQITPQLLRAEAAHKKPTSAAGLDGVSRADLLSVPDSVLAGLVNMYHRAQTTGHWPSQLSQARLLP